MNNEMVSLGDTAISLHILQPPPEGGCSAKGQIWTRGRKLEFRNLGEGVFCQRSDLDSGKKIGVWKLGGGCSAKGQIWTQGRKLEFGNLGGVFCQRSDLDSGKKIGV